MKPNSESQHLPAPFRLDPFIRKRFLLAILIGFEALLPGLAKFAAAGGAGSEPNAEYVIEHWDSQNGLPRSTISSIAQTPDGYLWMGTANGLARFDGVQFRVFTHFNQPGMVRGVISCLLVDSKGRLWAGTELGQLCRIASGRFVQLRKSSWGEINCLAEDDQGAIWVGAGNGLCRVENDEVVPALVGQQRPVRRLQFDRREKALWFDNDGLLAVFREGVLTAPTTAGLHGEIFVNSVFPKSGGGLWIFDYPHAWRESEGSSAVTRSKPIPFSTSDWFAACLDDGRGGLWLGTNWSGLYWLSNTGEFKRFTKESGLRDNAIRSLFQDREGNIWVGTHQGGLHRLRRRYFQVYEERHGLSDGGVKTVSVGPGEEIWTTSRNSEVYKLTKGKMERVEEVGRADTLLFDSSGNLWTNWLTGRTARFVRREERWTLVEEKGENIFNRSTVIYEDRRGGIWFGSHFGLCSYRGGEYARHIGEGISDPVISVASLAEGADGRLWIGSLDRGLYYMDSDRESILPVEGFSRIGGVTSLLADDSGAVWAGTNGDGLWRVDDSGLRRYGLEDGLPDLNIYGIVEDDRRDIWLGTVRGIVRITKSDSEEIHCVTFGKGDGLINPECSADWHPSACKSADGRLWFATIGGLATVDPAHIVDDLEPPPVVIQTVAVDGASRTRTHDVQGREPSITVPAGGIRVEIHYAGLSYAAPERVLYRYRLEGLDKAWVEAGNRRTAYYSHVPPGEYRFQVIATNHQGVWNFEGASVALAFLPHYWQTFWFKGILAAGILVGIGGIVRYLSVQKLKHKLILLEQESLMESERARIARDMHDQLGSQLTHIGLLSELSKDHVGSSMAGSMARISQTTRNLMQKMDQLVWAVNPKKDRLEELVGYCTDYAESYLGVSAIACRVEIPEDLPEIHVNSTTRYEFFLTLGEALNNILKHAGADRVQLKWSLDEETLSLELADNGRGFNPAHDPANRNGLANMRRRMSDIQGAMAIESETGRGTRLTLSIPWSKLKGGGL